MNLKHVLFVFSLNFFQVTYCEFSKQDEENLKTRYQYKAEATRQFCDTYKDEELLKNNNPVAQECKKCSVFFNQTIEDFLNDQIAQEMAFNVINELRKDKQYIACLENIDKKSLQIIEKIIAILNKIESNRIEKANNFTDSEKRKIIWNFFIYVEVLSTKVIHEDIYKSNGK